jgi:alpha-1,3-mannosyl-glycoprotein beta-1,2-N-acetylglucosaminyltransferase
MFAYTRFSLSETSHRQGLRQIKQNRLLPAPVGVLMHKASSPQTALKVANADVLHTNMLQRASSAQTLDAAAQAPLPNLPIPDTSAGPITTFVQKGGRFPIIMLTHKRPEMLRRTLNSLLAVRGVTADGIFVMQHGKEQATLAVIEKDFKLKVFIDNVKKIGRPNQNMGAMRIAQHYKFALTTAFKEAAPAAPAVLVVEDDLLFSPDFLEFFTATAPLLEVDKTVPQHTLLQLFYSRTLTLSLRRPLPPQLFAISAWNDNGFSGMVRDPFQLHRTGFFPGLGWLLSRELYEKELQPR